MKKKYFICLVFVLVAVVSLVTFSKVMCDDDETASEIFGNTATFSRYEELLVNILLQKGTVCEHFYDTISSQSIIAYLARYEKSPPFSTIA